MGWGTGPAAAHTVLATAERADSSSGEGGTSAFLPHSGDYINHPDWPQASFLLLNIRLKFQLVKNPDIYIIYIIYFWNKNTKDELYKDY